MGAALSLCWPTLAWALGEFDQWTIDDGLPQNSVQAVLRARDGYLWLGTFDGLARFDGLRFAVFDKSNTPGLEANTIVCLHEDEEGSLWMGFGNGQVARYADGRFTTFGNEQGLPGSAVFAISGGPEDLWIMAGANPIRVGEAWIAGIQTLRWRGGRAEPAELPGWREGIRDFWWNAREGSIWSIDERGLHHFIGGRATSFAELPSVGILAAHHDQFQNVWLLLEDGRLACMQDGRLSHFVGADDGLPVSWTVDPDNPRHLLVTRDAGGALWLSGMGVWLGHLKDGVFTSFRNPNPSGGRVNAIHVDPDDNVWIATDGAGLLRVRRRIIEVYSMPEGLASGNIYPVIEDREGAVWVGAWDKGLARIKNGRVTNFTQAEGLHYPKVTSLLEDRDGRIWVGTFGGLSYLEDDRFHPAPEPLGRPGHVVSAMLHDRRGHHWFGSDLGLLEFSGGTNLHHYTLESGLAANDVKCLLEGADGAIWVGTYGGLSRIHHGRVTTWTEKDGLPSNQVRSLCQTEDGALWIGTQDGGLGRMLNGSFLRFTVADGMFNNGVFQILEDSRGYFWMSSNKGIHRVHRRELEVWADGHTDRFVAVAYGKSDGLRSLECNGGRWPAGIRARDGRLWFPTQDGVAVVDPELVVRDLTPPQVVIESCLLDRRPVDFANGIVVPPGTENFEIQYTGLTFANADRVQFRYRLVGMDRHWVDAGTRRAAYYSHVPPGEYRFLVTAANRDGIWNPRGAELLVRVRPSWWQTAWFRGLALVGLAGVVLGFFEMRISRLKRARARQEAFSRLVLESQEVERKRIAAELHDGLGQNLLIAVNRVGKAVTDCGADATARERLHEVESLLHEAIHEVRVVSQNLRPTYLEKIGLTKSLEAAVRKAADASSIEFSSRIEPVDHLFRRGDDIHVFRMVQEALNNVLKHSRATAAHVRVAPDDGAVVIEVADNGRGFNPAQVAPGASLSPGLGLVGMIERVQLLGGTWFCRSEPGRGTTLTMRIPVRDVTRSGKNPRDALRIARETSRLHCET